MGGKYWSYSELSAGEWVDRDYRIRTRTGWSGVAVMAPHGGDIEPGTTEIAEALSLDGHSFYSFEGIRADRNMELHIASTEFDEPLALDMAHAADTVVTLHGCRGGEPAVFVGGLDSLLVEEATERLALAGFSVREDPRFPGRHAGNLCNRSLAGRGLQLEISRGLRLELFPGLTRADRRCPRALFHVLVDALRPVLFLRAPGTRERAGARRPL